MQLFKFLTCNSSNYLHANRHKSNTSILSCYNTIPSKKITFFSNNYHTFTFFFKQLLYYYICMEAFLQTLYMQTNIANYLHTSKHISTTTILLHINTIPNHKQHTHWGILSNNLYAINHWTIKAFHQTLCMQTNIVNDSMHIS